MEIIPELTLDLIKSFARCKEEDIIYIPNKPESKEMDYCLFFYKDKHGNLVYAYNRHLITGETINKYNYKYTCGCLMLFCNTTKNFTYPKSFSVKLSLSEKVWYTHTNPIYVKC